MCCGLAHHGDDGGPASRRSDCAEGDSAGARGRERAAAPDHQGTAAPPLRPPRRKPAGRPTAARARGGRADRGCRRGRSGTCRSRHAHGPHRQTAGEPWFIAPAFAAPARKSSCRPWCRPVSSRAGCRPRQQSRRFWSPNMPTTCHYTAQIYARQGISLDRSTLADWVGRASWHLRPVHERPLARLKLSPKLFADETTAPVLDPGRGQTKTGQLWAYARDDRPLQGSDPAGCGLCLCAGSQGRTADRPSRRLQRYPAGRRLWRLSGARRQERRNARLLLGACALALLRTRRSRSSADRQRSAPAHRRTLSRRGRHPRPDGAGTSCRAPGTEPDNHRRARALAAREAWPDQPEDQARRGDPLHALARKGSPASPTMAASRSIPTPSSARSVRSHSTGRMCSSQAPTTAPSTGPSSPR